MRNMPLIAGLVAAATGPAIFSAAAQDAPERCGDLPVAVAKTQAAIRAAATTRDLPALVALADRDASEYGFGDVEDLAAYWTMLKGDGTDIPAIVAAVFAQPCVVYRAEEMTEYAWPSAVDVPYAELSEAEKASMEALYDGHFRDQYLEGPDLGYYAGWRGFIAEDGRWTAFLAGD